MEPGTGQCPHPDSVSRAKDRVNSPSLLCQCVREMWPQFTPCINHCAFSTETGRRDALFGDEYGNTVFILHTSIKELLGHFRHIIRCLCLYVQVDVLFSLEKREQEKGMQRRPGTRTVPLHWEMPPKLKGQNQAHPIK